MIFFVPPKDFKPAMNVSACFITHGKEFLYLKNGRKGEFTGLWGVVGGKIEKDESARAAMTREILEETGITLAEKDLKLFKTIYIKYPKFDYVYNIFHSDMNEKPAVKIDNKETVEYRWVTEEQALKLPLIPDEDSCVKMFCKEILNRKK